MTQPREYIETLEAIIRAIVRRNDSEDGAIGDVRAELGEEAAETLREVFAKGPVD